MNSSNSQSSSIDKNSPTHHSKHATFLSTYRPHQSWSLPDSIIYSITKNPSSSKAYEKMIQTCKHFFIKKPILVISRVYLYNNEVEWRTWFNGRFADYKNISSKFWITYELCSELRNQTDDRNFLSSIIQQVYQSDIKNAIIVYQNISFNDFLFLFSKCEKVLLSNTAVFYEDGSLVVLEKLFELLHHIKDFRFNPDDDIASSIITSTTAQKLIEIPHFSNLSYLTLTSIPEVFDIKQFCDNIKKNKKTRFYLQYGHRLSNVFRG